MPAPSALHVVPRDPSSPPSLSAPELSTCLAHTWAPWHPSSPPSDALDEDDPRRFDDRVRELARIDIELLWDELESRGLTTGEIVEYEVFPSPISGYRPLLLALAE
ncbi:MAG: hypothetical protein KDK70_27615 [Myxococcales bacterium]|nr:hypothetical protein [Myxococcales bacterium]